MSQKKSRRSGAGNQVDPSAAFIAGGTVREPIAALIRRQYPDWDPSQPITKAELKGFREAYIQDLFSGQQREISGLEREVLESVENAELLSKNLVQAEEQKLSLGQRLADHIAQFGGSWTFILFFFGFMLVWTAANAYALRRPFDPYPFILLNLILSCLAAVQAPLIMMSQNRQEEKDRARALHDYQINLKAEIEIRQLHEKLDQLILQHNQRLFELQQVQIDLLEELLEISGNSHP